MLLLSLPTRERGLKYLYLFVIPSAGGVAPHAGAWIEIVNGYTIDEGIVVAPHAGAWIEMS